MSTVEIALCILRSNDCDYPIQIVPAEDEFDCAFIPLGTDGEVPPAVTVGYDGDTLKALYHATGPNDTTEVPVECVDEYAVVTVPQGTVRVPLYCVRG